MIKNNSFYNLLGYTIIQLPDMIMTLYQSIYKKTASKNTFPTNDKDAGHFHSKRNVKKSNADKYDNMEVRKRMNNMEVSISSLMLKLDAVCKRLDKLDHVF